MAPDSDAACCLFRDQRRLACPSVGVPPVWQSDRQTAVSNGCKLRRSPKLAQVCSAELTHEFDHKTRGGLAVWLPAPRPGAVERRTKGESGAPQARKFEILPVGKMKHAFGVDETVLPTGKSCSWCGSVLESTNGLIFESAEGGGCIFKRGAAFR